MCVSETAPARKEREREREEEERAHSRRPTSFDLADDLETSRHKPRSPFDFDFESHQDCTLRLHWWTQRPRSHAFDFAPFNFTDFARLQLHRDGTDRIEFAIEKWLGFDEFDQIWWIFFGWVLMNLIGSVFIYWEMVLYICLETEKMWEIRRKYVFYIIFSNTTKH